MVCWQFSTNLPRFKNGSTGKPNSVTAHFCQVSRRNPRDPPTTLYAPELATRDFDSDASNRQHDHRVASTQQRALALPTVRRENASRCVGRGRATPPLPKLVGNSFDLIGLRRLPLPVAPLLLGLGLRVQLIPRRALPLRLATAVRHRRVAQAPPRLRD